MKLRANLIAHIVKAQIEHIKQIDPEFLNRKYNHLRKVIILSSKILADNEHCWRWNSDIRLLNGHITISQDSISLILISLITVSVIQFEYDTDMVASEMEKVQDSSLGFVESLEALIQSSLNQYSDYQSFFRVLTLAGISEQALYAETITHLAITKFRIQNGYVGLRAGNYIHVDEEIGWDDLQCAKEYAYGVGLSPNGIDYVLEGLGKSYAKIKLKHTEPFTRVVRANLTC